IWGDKVYFGVHNGKLYGLYKETGEIVTGFPVGYIDMGGYQDVPAGDGPISTANGVIYTNNDVRTFCIRADNGEVLWYSPAANYMTGGVTYTYNYPSVTIGRNEIVSVYPRYNQIIVYCMPTIAGTRTITPTRTATQTITPSVTFNVQSSTMTITMTETITPSMTQTKTMTPSASPTITATPLEFYLILYGNHPNPANEHTYIVYELGRKAEVEVKIYTISGEKIREIKGEGEVGRNSIMWDLKNRRGRDVSSGVYIYSIEAREEVEGEMKVEWGKIAVIK
ncbi:MAG: T9SS type A sorting domain-containing protein, partial [Candidatus Goldbacteria bacterium]|nr:T9SS type A sorting domain-containing protein [Candidatus Goldiibacteriota bacterium]